MEYYKLLKPGECITEPDLATVCEGATIPIVNDNAVILFVKQPTSPGYITVYGGDGVMAGGPCDFFVDGSGDTFIYLESGRFAIHENGKQVIKLYSENDFFAGLIQLA